MQYHHSLSNVRVARSRSMRIPSMKWFLRSAIVFGLAVGSVVPSSPARAQSLTWVSQFGTAGFESATAVAATGGLVIVAGANTQAFPDAQVDGLGCFVRGVDYSGSVAWTEEFGCTTGGHPALAIRGKSIYVASTLGGDGLVTRLDMAGNIVWQQLIGSDSLFPGVEPNAIAVRGSDVYVGGGVSGTLRGQTNASTCPSVSVCDGLDSFLMRFTSKGKRSWTAEFGTANDDWVNGLAVDRRTLYLVGVDEPACAGCGEGFVASYTTNGARLWYRTDESIVPHAVAVSDATLYVAGSVVTGEAPFGAHAGFVQASDRSGNVTWRTLIGSQQGEGTNGTDAYGLSVTDAGIYTCGATFAPLEGQTQVDDSGSFASRLTGSGSIDWVLQFGTGGAVFPFLDSANAIVGTPGAAFVVGHTLGAFPSNVSSGGYDAYVASISS